MNGSRGDTRGVEMPKIQVLVGGEVERQFFLAALTEKIQDAFSSNPLEDSDALEQALRDVSVSVAAHSV